MKGLVCFCGLLALVISADAEVVLDTTGEFDARDVVAGNFLEEFFEKEFGGDLATYKETWTVNLTEGKDVAIEAVGLGGVSPMVNLLGRSGADFKNTRRDNNYDDERDTESAFILRTGKFHIVVTGTQMGRYRIKVTSRSIHPDGNLWIARDENFALRIDPPWWGEEFLLGIRMNQADVHILVEPSFQTSLEAAMRSLDQSWEAKGIRGRDLKRSTTDSGRILARESENGRHRIAVIERDGRIFTLEGEAGSGSAARLKNGMTLALGRIIPHYDMYSGGPTTSAERVTREEERFSVLIPAGWRGKVSGTHIVAERGKKRINVYTSDKPLTESFETIDYFYGRGQSSRPQNMARRIHREATTTPTDPYPGYWAWGVIERNSRVFYYKFNSDGPLDAGDRRILDEVINSIESTL